MEHRRRELALFILPVLAACGCSLSAAPAPGRVAECYAAFMSVGMDAADPALGFDAEVQRGQAMANMEGLNRLAPFTARAVEAIGEEAFLEAAAAWRLQPQNDMSAAPDDARRQAVYQHVLAEAGTCHAELTRWGAPTDGGVIATPGT